jgi:anti-sigma factor RsiW
MQGHAEILSQCEAYHEGGLEDAARRRFEAHLEACEACRRLVEAWPHAVPAPDLAPAVLAALAPAEPVFFTRPGWLAPIAAALAVGLLVAAFWRPERTWLNADRGFAALGDLGTPRVSQTWKGGL